MFQAFLYGIVLAFGLIIPLGAQNIFIFNQGAAQQHFLHALPAVLAASVCDALLILLAVLGISVAVLKLVWLKILVFIIGFFFLLYVGYITWHSKPTFVPIGTSALSPKRQVGFAASVSLLNPHALVDVVGVIGTSSLNFTGAAKWAYTFACIFVSCCWFFGLAVAGHFIHKLDKTGRWLVFVNKLSALIIWGIAVYLGWQIISNLSS